MKLYKLVQQLLLFHYGKMIIVGNAIGVAFQQFLSEIPITSEFLFQDETNFLFQDGQQFDFN